MIPRKTVLAIARAHVSPSKRLSEYLNTLSDRLEEAWFARAGGDVLLAEMGEELNAAFSEHLAEFFRSYMAKLGVFDAEMMNVEITDSRRGSWMMEAAISIYASVGTAYTILKGVGELPKIADGIEEGKTRLEGEFHELFGKQVKEKLEPYLKETDADVGLVKRAALDDPIDVSFFIDARPLRGLTPDIVKTHAIHLSVGLSRSGLSVENLGDGQLDNLRIGLFKSFAEANTWSFRDAYIKTIPLLGSKQTISLAVEEFKKRRSTDILDLTDNRNLYVDCWIQDNHGIYLFNFLLE